MSRWSSGSPKLTVPQQDALEVVVEPWNRAPATEVIDLQAEEGRMPVERSSDEFINKLVDEVRHGLKPDFDALNVRFDAVNARIDTANAGIASLTTNVADQAKVSTFRFDSLDQRFGALDDSLNAIKKHLGI